MIMNNKILYGIGAFIILAILTRKMWMKKGAVEETKNKVVDTNPKDEKQDSLDRKNKPTDSSTVRSIPIGKL